VPADIIKQLDPIFKPRSLAVIGASNDVSKWGGRAFLRVLRSDFRGRAYPINPRAAEVQGVKAYADVNDVPEDIDLAVFAMPAEFMPEVMKSCVKKGIKGGVVITADFAETGAKGQALEDEMVRIARQGGLRFVGPNGMGIWTSAAGLNVALDAVPIYGSLAFISQSGTYGGALARAADIKGFGLSKFISIGNQADLTASDYLEYLAYDPDTKVIAFYMEGFKDGRRFFEKAKEVSRIKPVLIFKGGSSEQGARATMTHTASIAGADHIFQSMCRQAGIIRAPVIGHLFIMAEALIGQPLPKGNRVAVIGTGGQGVVTVDACSHYGLEVPELKMEDARRIKEILPPQAPMPRNPVDFAGGARTAEQEARVIEMIASLDYIDAVITNSPRLRARGADLAEQIKVEIDGVKAVSLIPEKYGKPIIMMNFQENHQVIADILQHAGIPTFNTPEHCAIALFALMRYAEIKKSG